MNFNLIDDNFIRIEDEPTTVSIRYLFENAHKLKNLSDPDPLVKASQMRFLLAMTQSIFKINNLDDWGDVWEQKEFSLDQLTKYFDKYRDKFNLFDKHSPFYQSIGAKSTKEKSICLLEMHQSNESSLYCNGLNLSRQRSSSEIARSLLSYSCFVIGTGRGNYCQTPLNYSTKKNVYMCFIEGQNLFETLLFNTISLNDIKFDHSKEIPIWESENVTDYRGGFLSYLTFSPKEIFIDSTTEKQSFYQRDYLDFAKKESRNNYEEYFSILEDPYCPYSGLGDKRGVIKLDRCQKVWRDWLSFVSKKKNIDLKVYSNFLNIKDEYLEDDKAVSFWAMNVVIGGSMNNVIKDVVCGKFPINTQCLKDNSNFKKATDFFLEYLKNIDKKIWDLLKSNILHMNKNKKIIAITAMSNKLLFWNKIDTIFYDSFLFADWKNISSEEDTQLLYLKIEQELRRTVNKFLDEFLELKSYPVNNFSEVVKITEDYKKKIFKLKIKN